MLLEPVRHTMKIKNIRPEFVIQFPSVFEQGVLYISEEFDTAGHLCCCGCSEKVITPLNPAKWHLLKEENTVSLWPSIGNWNYACKSHYVINKNKVIEAGQFNTEKIEAVRRRDRRDMDRYVAMANVRSSQSSDNTQKAPVNIASDKNLISVLVTFWKKLWRP